MKLPQGKAPATVSEQIRELVIQDVFGRANVAVESGSSWWPTLDPQSEIRAGQPVGSNSWSVPPEIVLERITATVSRTLAPVTDEQVADQLDQLRDKKAAWLPVEGQAGPRHAGRGEVASRGIVRGQPFTLVLGEAMRSRSWKQIMQLPG